MQLQVIETRKTVFGVEHSDTLTSTTILALLYRDQRQWKKAEELQVQVMKIRKTILGMEHPDLLKSIANLALTYRD